MDERATEATALVRYRLGPVWAYDYDAEAIARDLRPMVGWDVLAATDEQFWSVVGPHLLPPLEPTRRRRFGLGRERRASGT